MLGSEWMKLLRLIPQEHRDNLIVRTTSGVEINVLGIIRMEEQYLIVRGRAAGSTQDGKPYFIPYDQMDYLSFYSSVKDREIQLMYGEKVSEQGLDAEAAAEQQEALAEEERIAEPVPAAPAPPSALPRPASPSSVYQPLPSKTAILERLRNRPPGGTPPASSQK
ncbi:MAG: hypothetical protein ACK4RK_18205 [Gemmataceae bacterium]